MLQNIFKGCSHDFRILKKDDWLISVLNVLLIISKQIRNWEPRNQPWVEQDHLRFLCTAFFCFQKKHGHFWTGHKRIIHFLRTQKFSKKWHFLPLDAHTYVRISGGGGWWGGCLPPDTQTSSVCVLGDKKVSFLGTFCVRTKWMIPNSRPIFHSHTTEVF